MSSLEKHHNKKKLIFNGGNYLLTPINKKINSLNFFNTNKKENNSQNKNGTKVIVNKINIAQLKKKSYKFRRYK